ncbi:MAG: molybdopterin synthase sulfur carrier subunit [Caulobacteraceae bacterium]|nr:molybdopterin synthase sulfur carrier subunit [Caulobacteraceae bacterium]
MTRVFIPSQLQSYCQGATRVEASGDTVDAVLRDLDRLYPGIRFRVVDEQDRIRRHMRIFIGREAVRHLGASLREGDEVLIFGALSGG